MKPDKFIILSPGFPKDESDSTCLPSPQSFVKILKEKYPELEIIVLAFQYPFETAAYEWNNCRVIAMGGKGRGKLFRLLLWCRVWRKLKQLTRKGTVAGLLSFWCGECTLTGFRFARKNGIPHQCWILGQDAKKDNRYVHLIKPQPNELISISDFLQDSFYQNHKIRPALVIPNGIDPRSFKTNLALRDIDILGSGNLVHLKRYDFFIEAIAAVKKHIPGIRSVICGKGPEKKTLGALIEKMGLQDNISLLDEMPHAQVLELMQRSRVFLHPSSFEGFSTVCLEAHFAGAEVISFHQPQHDITPGWHIVNSLEEMISQTVIALRKEKTGSPLLCPYLMEDSVKKMMQLFGR